MKIVFKIPYSDWDNFISSHPNGTVFQSPEMHEFFKTIRRFDPLLLAAYNKTDNLCGVLIGIYLFEKNGIGKLLSTRFVIYGGPLLTGSNETKKECLDLLLKELVEQTRKKALFVQFRNYFSWEGYLPIFEKNGFSYLERLNYIVDTSGGRGMGDEGRGALEVVMKNMSESRRRQLNKALKSGAEIIEPGSIEQVKEFYDILYKLYRYKVRKPLADWSFFENFYKQTIPRPGIGIIRLIRYKDRIIGGILAP
ncbi:MAG: hypothetical protein KAR09_04660, partial [Bacteroidales bacterium]|nr:hypothetical protein [Bacteroidales bacterium]